MTSSPHAITMRRLATASALASAIALTGCVTGGPRLVTPDPPPIPDAGPNVPSSAHVVLKDGQQVVANTAAGKMKIEAGPGLRRVFDWDGLRRGAIVDPRASSFAGGKTNGLTYDGTPKVWDNANGITKLRYEEGERHFENMDDAMIWMQIRRLYYTYNNQGVVLGWKREGNTLHTELWQFYVDGKKPTSMPDARDSSINVGKLVVEPQKMYPHLVFNDGHTEPYNAETASSYKGGGSAGKADESGKQADNCNWFKRLFHQCPAPKPAPAPAEDTASAKPAQPAPAPSEPKPAEPPKPELPKATITGNVVNIRSKPTTKSDVLRQAKKGDTVEIVKSENKWSYVQFADGKKGWVADFLLKKQ
ncbi:SH3 domain-containing protein [Salinisphaera sp. Q1T1-3]|uniref:SH3 domain-containing protein n=1 Tax=Salinisphaera sp. Q1T1-3 TaxID=2321229 RepID=UPI000E767E20|nr:SH3 domain-containing protein [Salinisphaera sp. Q1T1-3]RJS92320.1 SH3 domain-containing protein [Salinisphaera sp. Q1T1-3]